jgi:hypothetical protein
VRLGSIIFGKWKKVFTVRRKSLTFFLIVHANRHVFHRVVDAETTSATIPLNREKAPVVLATWRGVGIKLRLTPDVAERRKKYSHHSYVVSFDVYLLGRRWGDAAEADFDGSGQMSMDAGEGGERSHPHSHLAVFPSQLFSIQALFLRHFAFQTELVLLPGLWICFGYDSGSDF